jgi:uncharacterized protein (TIGR02594 family)
MPLPKHYEWLNAEGAPKMLVEALKLYGLKEMPGKGKSNPEILKWAKELGVSKIYEDDDIAWCALSHAIVAKRAGKEVPFTGYDLLRAKSFAKWGMESKTPQLGDTLVFQRPNGFHVGLYVGEDKEAYHVLGGNQGNAYNIMRIAKNRLYAARRPDYGIKPKNVRKVLLEATGGLSNDES